MAYKISPNKQDLLVSGTNIKTINSNSLLGSGNLTISGLPSSVNPTDANKVVAVDSSGVASWQYAGLGSGSFGTDNVIIGRSKPSALTGTNNVLIGPNSGGTISSANDCFLVGVPIQWHDFSGEINIQNRVRISPALNSVSLGSGTISSNSVSISANQALRGVSIFGASGMNGVTIGYSCGGSDYAVCIGAYAGQFGISQKSVAVGHEAHKWGSASVEGFNVATGFQSLHYAGTGQYNVAIGNQTLYNTNSKNSCVGIGSFAGYNANTANEFYLDSRSSALASNALEKTNSLMYGQFNATPASQTLTTNSQFTATYGVSVSTAGYGLSIKSGSNAKIGVTGAFPGGNPNTMTVNTMAVTANSIILVSAMSFTGGLTGAPYVSAITASTSFVITVPDNSFTGTVGWVIIEKA